MIYAKVPYQLQKRCRDNNVWQEVCYFYLLKSRCKTGLIRTYEIPKLASLFNVHESSLYRNLNRLIACGYVTKHRTCYRLISYDKLFILLGYDLSSYSRKKRVRGSLSITKIQFENKAQFKDKCTQFDIKINLSAQFFNVLNLKLKEAKKGCTASSYCDDLHRLINTESNQDHLNNFLNHQINESNGKSSDANHDITLSCQGVADLIGLKSHSSGCRIEHRLKDLQYISVVNRMAFVEITEMTFPQYKRYNTDPSYRFYKGGVVMKQLANKLQVL